MDDKKTYFKMKQSCCSAVNPVLTKRKKQYEKVYRNTKVGKKPGLKNGDEESTLNTGNQEGNRKG